MKRLTRRDFLKVLGGSFVGGMLSRWLAPLEVHAEETKEPLLASQPFYHIDIVSSRELIDEKKQMLEKVVRHFDFRNVLGRRPLPADFQAAKVVEHTLKTGEFLYAVGIPIGSEQAIWFYQVTKPLVGKKGRFESAAYLLRVRDRVADVEAVSINQRLVQPDKQMKSGDPCGGCVDIVWGPWEYQSWVCYSYDLVCMGRCCGGCMVPCFSGNYVGCVICVGIWCPLCSFSCCQRGGMGCVSCGGAP